jgi:hypothetical protein
MLRTQTLQAFLSPQYLREVAGPKVYARGEEYVANNRVQLHEHARDEAIAEVMGSQPYRVELRLTSSGLTADCTCPAISAFIFLVELCPIDHFHGASAGCFYVKNAAFSLPKSKRCCTTIRRRSRPNYGCIGEP